MYQDYGDFSTNLPLGNAALGGKPVREINEADLPNIDRTELPEACYKLVFGGIPFAYNGKVYREPQKTGTQELRFIQVGNFTYLEQNPKKDSKWGQFARLGHKILWIIYEPTKKWIGRVVDKNVTKLP